MATPDQSGPLLLLAALAHELAPAIAQLRLCRQADCYQGPCKDRQVIAAVTGPGGPNAAQQLDTLAARHRPAGVLLIGLAGSLDSCLPAGKSQEFTWLLDGKGRALCLTGAVPVRGSPADRPDDVPALISLNEILESPVEKRLVHQQHGALAVDMESFTLARRAAQLRLPFRVLRAICDPVDMTLPRQSLSWVSQRGKTRLLPPLFYLATRPWRLPWLLRLKEHSAVAAMALAYQAEALLRSWQPIVRPDNPVKSPSPEDTQ